jgi:hypothetical protein
VRQGCSDQVRRLRSFDLFRLPFGVLRGFVLRTLLRLSRRAFLRKEAYPKRAPAIPNCFWVFSRQDWLVHTQATNSESHASDEIAFPGGEARNKTYSITYSGVGRFRAAKISRPRLSYFRGSYFRPPCPLRGIKAHYD